MALSIYERDARDEAHILKLTRKDFARGLVVLATKYPKHFGNLLSNWDATTGDALIQCAAFGELKYG